MSTFFDHQEQALRRSRFAATGFALSTLIVALVVTLVIHFTLRSLRVPPEFAFITRPVLALGTALGINAFSLGWELEHAILVVTRGAVERLTRGELQGRVAHEFSHILHGDMALNTRMLVWLAGLFGVYQTGSLLVVGGAAAGGDRASPPSGLPRLQPHVFCVLRCSPATCAPSNPSTGRAKRSPDSRPACKSG